MLFRSFPKGNERVWIDKHVEPIICVCVACLFQMGKLKCVSVKKEKLVNKSSTSGRE